jgi:DnaJ-class molecular chaperone|tara:strand:+ start:870 stop:1010 length:141 start_codon:yes stop_codon:yes gene_type:complete
MIIECPNCEGEGNAYYSFPDHSEQLAQCEDCVGSGSVDIDEEEEAA